MWFTESSANKIGFITPSGTVAEFVLTSTIWAGGPEPEGIVNGPDGNLWFTEPGTNKIGMITPY